MVIQGLVCKHIFRKHDYLHNKRHQVGFYIPYLLRVEHWCESLLEGWHDRFQVQGLATFEKS